MAEGVGTESKRSEVLNQQAWQRGRSQLEAPASRVPLSLILRDTLAQRQPAGGGPRVVSGGGWEASTRGRGGDLGTGVSGGGSGGGSGGEWVSGEFAREWW